MPGKLGGDQQIKAFNIQKNDLATEYSGKKEYVQTYIHPAEQKLILFIREIGFGEVQIKVQNGLPVLVIKTIESRKLL